MDYTLNYNKLIEQSVYYLLGLSTGVDLFAYNLRLAIHCKQGLNVPFHVQHAPAAVCFYWWSSIDEQQRPLIVDRPKCSCRNIASVVFARIVFII